MAAVVKLKYGEIERSTRLVNNQLHIPTIKDMFGLGSVDVEGVAEPADDRGFTFATYLSGSTLHISGSPAQAAVLSVARGIGEEDSMAEVLCEIRDGVKLLTSAKDVDIKTVAFSAVSGTAANQLLDDVDLAEADGFHEAPFETPADASDIDIFDYSQFVNEDAGTPSFVEYHKEQLQACGVRMGRSGYAVLDLHKAPMYHVQVGSKRYSGGVDGGVVPYAIRAPSAAKLLRIGFEHKQSSADKATFRMNHPDVVQTEVATPRQYSFNEGRGQVVCCLLAAHAMCQLPLDVDLTDGKVHHLLRLRGDLLLVYEGCTPKQAYHEMADFLIKQETMLTGKRRPLEPPEDLEEQLRRPIKKLKGLVQGAALTEQVESLVSACSSKEEQVCMAYEIARHWAHPIPACVSDLLER